MYGNNFFMPYGMNYQIPSGIGFGGFGNGINSAVMGTTAKTGLLGKLSGISGTLHRVNWGNLLNNTSRTLGVINQAIPIVRQAGPMINNMKSMLRIASAFKDETVPRNRNIKRDISISSNTSNVSNNTNIDVSTSSITNNDNTPSFFIN